ncbi:MAG TPA: MarR family transcriptional regulator [Solirubrobacteraceae bacterium]|nr:MarR family transcriptional regulator [Solirubrobacteraceae bacterium]
MTRAAAQVSADRHEEIAAELPLLLRTLAQAHQRMRNAAAGDGITGTQISVMTAVVNNPGLDHRSVCKATFIDESTVASVVANLAQRGLIMQSRSEADRRRYELRASNEAWELVYASRARVTKGNDQLLSPLDAQQRIDFIRSLELIAYADRNDAPARYVIPRPDGQGEPHRVQRGLGRLVRGCLQRHTRVWSEELRQPITALQYLVLRTLEDAGAIDQRALGELTIVDKATLTVLLQRLERASLIDRVPDERDRRRRLLALDPSIQPLLSAARAAESAVAARFLEPLTEAQREEFIAALKPVAAHARQEFIRSRGQRRGGLTPTP